MSYTIVGLGNPGEEYRHTRHNVGQDFVRYLAEKYECGEWKYSKAKKGEVASCVFFGKKVTVVLPDTFMNSSGNSVKTIISSASKRKKLIIVQDELDLPIGSLKISFNRGAAGHRGIESIIRAVGGKDFWRVRIGVSPATPSGMLKKPKGETAVKDFVLSRFSRSEAKKIEAIQPLFVHKIEEILKVE